MSKPRIKCPSCLTIGVVLNLEGKNLLECGSCNYRITRDELESYTLNSNSATTCPPNCNGECADDQR